MQQGFFAFRRASSVHATIRDFTLAPVDRAAALGAILRHSERLTVWPLLYKLQNVRNDFPGPLDQHRVPDLQAEAIDLVHVVEGRTADSDTAHLHRLEDRDRRKRARATDLHANVVYDRGLLPRGVFVGDGPARCLRRESQFMLNWRGINLYDHAVDLVREVSALRLPDVAISEHFIDSRAEPPIVRRSETQLLKSFQGVGMLGERDLAVNEQIVG